MMNTNKPHAAKLIQMHPKPKGHPKALESILLGLEMIERKIANHFEQEAQIKKQ